MSPRDVAVVRAGVERVPRLAPVWQTAMAEDPMARAGFDDARGTAWMLGLLCSAHARAGSLWEAGDGAGAAGWLPPGRFDVIDDVDRALREGFAGFAADGGDAYWRFWDWVWTFQPDEEHWFLDIVAVDPARRGEGIGAALVRHGLSRAAVDGVPALLDTGNAENVPLYEHLGFRVIAEGDAPGGRPHVWFMRAEPPAA